jgi:uncharacterized membrane protein YgdD (TMEM256/DUF423 family)
MSAGLAGRRALIAGTAFGGLAVAAGAFGAHALRTRLSPAGLDAWETAARYQMYHALALLLVGTLLEHYPSRLLRAAGALFLTGLVLFSGSLYVIAITGLRWPGAITPLGGVALLAGWGCLLWAVISPDRGER